MTRLVRSVAIALAGLAVPFAFGQQYLRSTSAGLEFAYDTAPVSIGEVRKVVATSGTVKPRNTVQIGSELSGRIKSIVSDFNAPVKAGDVLAVIDPKTFESKVKQAQADLQSAQAALISSEAAVRKAVANLENAEAAHERQRLLGQKGIAAQTNVDGSVRDLNVAKAEVAVAKGNLENARAIVAQKAAQLEQALIDLERTNVRTPISGIVLNRSVDVGQTVAASLQAPELFRIAGDLASIHIEAQVSEVDVGGVKQGQQADFQVDAYPGRTFQGRVEQVRLAPAAADTVVTYSVIIAADNTSLDLFPGMTAHVKIETAKRNDVPRVSLDAIRFVPPKNAKTSQQQSASLWSRVTAWLGTHAVTQTAGSPPDDEDSKSASLAKNDAETLIRRWTRRLQLDPQQVTQLKALVQSSENASTNKAMARTPKGEKSAKEAAATSIKSQIEGMIAKVLRPEQVEIFEAHRGGRRGSQSVSVWVLSTAGIPERRSVRVGLTDTHFAELTGKELAVGDTVIVRSRKAAVQ